MEIKDRIIESNFDLNRLLSGRNEHIEIHFNAYRTDYESLKDAKGDRANYSLGYATLSNALDMYEAVVIALDCAGMLDQVVISVDIN